MSLKPYPPSPISGEQIVPRMSNVPARPRLCGQGRLIETQFTRAIRWIVLVVFCVAPFASALAESYPMDGKQTQWVQPDGTALRLRVFGDESYAPIATEEGYTVILNKADRTYYFAETGPDGKSLVSSGVPAHRDPPSGLQKRLENSREAIAAIRDKNVERLDPEREARWAALVKAAQERRNPGAGPLLRALAKPEPRKVTGLMVLVQFPDDPSTSEFDPVVFPAPRNKIERFSNELGYTEDGNTDSVRGYFHDQSLGQFDLSHVVTEVVTLPMPRNFYHFSDYPTNLTLAGNGYDREVVTLAGDGSPKTNRVFNVNNPAWHLVRSAIAKLKDGGFDFSSLSRDETDFVIDASFLFAGQNSGNPDVGLWPSKWGLEWGNIIGPDGKTNLVGGPINVGTPDSPIKFFSYQITNIPDAAPAIGTLCHELGHLTLALPDLYDKDKGLAPKDRDGYSAGIGHHGQMASGNYNNDERTPAPINLYLKDILGWANITDISPAEALFTKLASTGNRGYRIVKPGDPKEFFLFENRSSGDKWAAGCPDQGILIWHVDEKVKTGNSHQGLTRDSHYLISLEQSDGRFDLEGYKNTGDDHDAYSLSESYDCGGFIGLFEDCSHTTSFFNNDSHPNADWWDGTPSGVAFEALSWPGPSMDIVFGPRMVVRLDDSGVGTLRWAVANTVAGTIRFSTALSGQSIVLKSEIVIDRDTVIDAGNLAKGITIRGGAPGASTRLFNLSQPVEVRLSGLTLSHGSADQGGAIYSVASRLTISGCTFHNNTASDRGSAIFLNNSRALVGIDNSTFTANVALNGCIWISQGDVVLQNCTVANNVNRSSLAGAGVTSFGSLILDNTILYGNQFLGGISDVQGDFYARGPNIVGVRQFGRLSGLTPITASPALGNLQDNGGPTFTMLPAANSAAVNAGYLGGAGPNWSKDQRGFSRPAKVGTNPVIGSVEVAQGAKIEVYAAQNARMKPLDVPWSIGGTLPGQGLPYFFKIRNAGNFPLTGLTVSVAGVDAELFSVTIPPASTVGVLEETTFQVRFRPASSGEKFAQVSIASNDPDQNPFQFALSAIGDSLASISRTTGGTPTRLSLSPRWNRPEEGWPPSSLSTTATSTPYDLVAFSVERQGYYTLTSASLNPTWDNLLFLYIGHFDSSVPLANVIVGEIDPFGIARFTVYLYPGNTYYAVTTGRTDFKSGDYALQISGPGAIGVFAPPADLSPKIGQTGISVYPAFSWSSANGAATEIFLGSAPESLSSLGVQSPGFKLTAPLRHNTTYYWRLDNYLGESVVSGGAQSFTTRASIEVTTLADENDGALGLGTGDSLREAIASAAAGEASAIEFAQNLSGQVIRLAGSPLSIAKNVTIDGSAMAGPVVKISGNNTARVFEIAAGITVGMNAIEITEGKAGPAQNGAGILNLGTLSLKDVTLRANKAPAGKGGGIHNLGSLVAESSTFSANDAEFGGGLSNEGAAAGATLTNVTFSGNTAVKGGGGILNASDARLALIHNTITENFVNSGRGAGIQIDSGTLAVDNSIIAGNDAINGSRAIHKTGGAITPGGRSIIGDNTSVSTEFPSGPLVGDASNGRDPLLSPLDSYGGRTQTRPPLPGSPALDAVVAGRTASRDQRGVQRPRGPASDIGAVESDLSSNANLAALAISAGKFNPVFLSDVIAYAIDISPGTSSVRVRMTPESGQATAAVFIRGVAFGALEPGIASPELTLNSGENVIEVIVTAENGATKKYSISVNRGVPPSTNTDLSALAMNSGSLNPAFSPAVRSYAAFVGNSTTSIVLTPAVTDPGARIEVAGSFGSLSPVASGAASAPFVLKVGLNLIEIRVTAKDGVTQATHTVTVQREAPALSNANLSALATSAGALSPAFSREGAFYRLSVDESVASATVTPTAAQSSSAIAVQVNGGSFIPVASGAISAPLALKGGANLVEVRVTAGDGATVRSYSVIVTRVLRSLVWASNLGNDTSGSASISADGRFVAFSSRANNLVANNGDQNNSEDVFVHDLSANKIERVSVSDAGNEGTYNGSGGKAHSRNPSISADGRYVAFQSRADNLVPGDTNGENDESKGEDIFVYDRTTKTIERASLRDTPPFQAQQPRAENPSISGDGRFVAFSSGDSDLVTGFDEHSNVNVYVRDRQQGTVAGIDVRFADFRTDNRDSLNPAISADGEFVAFEFSVNRSDFPQYQYRDIYVYQRSNQTVERITGDYEGLPSDGHQSKSPSISADGRYVAFASNMDGIDFDDINSRFDVFVHDRLTRLTRRASVDAPGLASAFGESINPSISGDGHFVAFESSLDGLAPGDTNQDSDIFLRNLETGEVTLLSVSSASAPGNRGTFAPSISFDGHSVAFGSDASNLVSNDSNGRSDVFAAVTQSHAPNSQARLASLTWSVNASSGFSPNLNSYTATAASETTRVFLHPSAADPNALIEARANSGDFSPVDSGATFSLPLVNGLNTIAVRVTAADRSTVNVYSLAVTRAASGNAALAGLDLAGDLRDAPEEQPPLLSLTPFFDARIREYTTGVPNNSTSLTVTPKAAEPNASVNVNGVTVASGTRGPAIPLNLGANPIMIAVTAQDGVTKINYVVTVFRAFSSDASLATLVAGAGSLTPAFATQLRDYAIEVPNDTTSLEIAATTTHPNATISVNGEPAATRAVSKTIVLQAGVNSISTLVRGPDGITTRTYTIKVTRAAQTSTAPVALSQTVQVAVGTTAAITLAGTDINGKALTFAIVRPPANGTLGGIAPALTYTPAGSSAANDSFTFKVNDGIVDSPAATVTINITARREISISKLNGQITIHFTGTLESAIQVTGPYTPVAGALSPLPVAPIGTSKFYIAR